jgi:hypothetical protein
MLGKISSSPDLENHILDALRRHSYRGEWFHLNKTTDRFIRLMNTNDLEGICKEITALIEGVPMNNSGNRPVDEEDTENEPR